MEFGIEPRVQVQLALRGPNNLYVRPVLASIVKMVCPKINVTRVH